MLVRGYSPPPGQARSPARYSDISPRFFSTKNMPLLSLIWDGGGFSFERRVMGIKDATTERELLEALREGIAEQLDDVDCSARDYAALSRRLMEVVRELKALDEAEREEADLNVSTEDEEFDPEDT